MTEHAPLAQLFAGVFLTLVACAAGAGLNDSGRLSAALGVDGAHGSVTLEAGVNAR